MSAQIDEATREFYSVPDILDYAYRMEAGRNTPQMMTELMSIGTNPTDLDSLEMIADGIMIKNRAMRNPDPPRPVYRIRSTNTASSLCSASCFHSVINVLIEFPPLTHLCTVLFGTPMFSDQNLIKSSWCALPL